jgi:glutathione S-transferase
LDRATLTIGSKNYGSWSLRGWLLARFSGIPFAEKIVPPDDPAMRAELLLLSPSCLVPCLTHAGISVWDTLAIGEYLNEIRPRAGLLPKEIVKRARCRSICGEMHSSFASMRSAMPMNLKGDFPNFKVWARAQADIDRITMIWRDCLGRFGRALQRLLQGNRGPARDGRMDRRGQAGTGRGRGARGRILTQAQDLVALLQILGFLQLGVGSFVVALPPESIA